MPWEQMLVMLNCILGCYALIRASQCFIMVPRESVFRRRVYYYCATIGGNILSDSRGKAITVRLQGKTVLACLGLCLEQPNPV